MKKALTFLLLAALLACPLSGCDTTDDDPTKTTTANKDNTIPEYNAADANSASDFEYKVGEDGGITITKYIGTDTTVVIPEKIDGKNVTVIGRDAFSYAYNSKVVSVDMPDTVKVITGGAFMYNKVLTTVRLSNSLEEINSAAFEGCTNLSTIQLPSTLTKIGMRAFADCASLKQIKIPKSINVWESESFALSGLETIELEEGLSVLGETAFGGTDIQRIEIPGSVKVIPSGVFSHCEKLETVVLNEGIERIEFQAFRKNTSLTEIKIPSTVIACSEFAFNECTALKKVKFEGNAPSEFKNEDAGLEELVGSSRATFTVYYHEGAEGFTSPEWNEYKTEIW